MKSKTIILALVIFSKTISIFGQSTDKYHVIDSLLKTNLTEDVTTVINKLKETLSRDSTDAGYWTRYSKAYFAINNDEAAKTGMRKAINLDLGNPEYYFEKGLLYNELHQLDTALKALEKAIAIRDDGKYYYWRGIMYQQLNDYENAEKNYRDALGKKFETAELFNNLSILLLEKKSYDEALQSVNKALLLNNRYAQAYSARAKIYFFLLKVDSACADKNKALGMGYKNSFQVPDSICNGTATEKLQYASDILAFYKFYSQALNGYAQLIANKVLTSANFLNRGYCYYQIKDYANAEKDYLKALTLPIPNHTLDLLYDNMSLLYYDQGNYQKSIEYSSKRIELNLQNHVPYIDRGLCYRKQKKYKEAEKDFNTSLSIKPDFHRAFGYRAFLYLELGQYQKSLEDASRAVQINSRYGYGYLVRAQAKQALGMTDFCLDLYYAQKYGDPDAEKGIKEFCK